MLMFSACFLVNVPSWNVFVLVRQSPFGRLVFVTALDSKLVGGIIDMVNQINAKELDLCDLPQDTLLATLSTYKLTR